MRNWGLEQGPQLQGRALVPALKTKDPRKIPFITTNPFTRAKAREHICHLESFSEAARLDAGQKISVTADQVMEITEMQRLCICCIYIIEKENLRLRM